MSTALATIEARYGRQSREYATAIRYVTYGRKAPLFALAALAATTTREA